MAQTPDWQTYQDDVSEFLSQLGFATKTDERLQGSRGLHAIDVTAKMAIAGISQLWLIECKKWRRPIPKERVLTFLGIVNDVGADRGLMLSESGFQAGAVRATANTNVTLTSLADFRQNSAHEIASLRSRVLDERAATLGQSFLAIWDLSNADRERILSAYVGPPDMLGRAVPVALMARLEGVRDSLEAARFRRWPVSYFALDDDLPISVMDWEGLLFLAEETISTCMRIYEHMMGSDTSIAHWKELQSPELTDLLDQIRLPRKEERPS